MNINLLKPKKENLTNYVTLGSFFIFISLFDLLTNAFLEWNFTGFLPDKFSYFTPLMFGVLGLYLIRIDFSGNKLLDKINANFNSSNFNAILTLLITFTLIKFIPPLLNWFIFDANFLGNTKEDCTGSGACWVFVKVWSNRFVYGMYPDAEQWRINSAFILLFIAVGASFFASAKYKKYLIIFLLFVYPVIGFKLISGGDFGLKYVETGAWGGLSLTFIVSAFSLILCFPIGMLLALGRRSNLPAIRYSSIGFIELWRGVPLITVLFMSAVMFPMFLPDGTYVDKLIRVLVAITLFEAAYMAEVIRGGLQALPKGQYEAAKSLGMGYWRMHFLIILPQALKLVIPGIANTFLALVKDTPLIFVVGLLELAGMVNLAKTNPKWLGMAMEGYVFAGLVFWVICYSMSRYSQNLEKKLSTER
ncbi:amino acid ABC transporter permease [Pelagibacteraceae bacterium]|nr:amino acid ABC transporter permease [Pelagibacteraceae bacterium]|tara:strand:- start:64 stop:1320 length:1257 start_codon:yes stop_codon:yes gene_type:complete